MKISFPFRTLVPTFFAGLIDDPILLLRIRSSGRHLMFDCGQIHHLAKRTFTNLDAVFISHAHMDHWMGIDAVVRQLIAAGKTVDIYGAPGLADRFEHKLNGYAWNLAEDYWSSFRVREIFPDRIGCELFSGAESFIRRRLEDEERKGALTYRNDQVDVRSTTCEHRIPSEIFRIDERPAYLIDREKLAELGLRPGPWLGDLKRSFLHRAPLPEALTLSRENGETLTVHDVPALLRRLLKPQPVHSIGYISDIGYTAANRDKILGLMSGVDLLLCECTFLSEGQDRARASSHLCTTDVNELLAELKPRFFQPMHLSRSYSRRSDELYRELNPPAETTLLRVPLQLTPRPLLADEIHWCDAGDDV
ncbi:MAG: ribonuclease Z [Desulfuromonas sp.]|nr:MAG: ribonuclease Z [Desulfuromonas sp.]